MRKKDKRSYRNKGLELSNLTFSTAIEEKYVRNGVREIALKLKKYRMEQGLSQEDLAEKVSVSVSTIKFIEQHQRAPSLPMLLKILFVLDRNANLWA